MMKMMKVFWVLAWDSYYPVGELGNVANTFLTREEAEEYAATVSYEHVYVEDVSEMLGIEE